MAGDHSLVTTAATPYNAEEAPPAVGWRLLEPEQGTPDRPDCYVYMLPDLGLLRNAPTQDLCQRRWGVVKRPCRLPEGDDGTPTDLRLKVVDASLNSSYLLMLVCSHLDQPPQPIERRRVQADQAERLDLGKHIPTLAYWDRWWPRTPDRRHYEAVRFTVRLVGAFLAVTFLAICLLGGFTRTVTALPLARAVLRRSYASCCFWRHLAPWQPDW